MQQTFAFDVRPDLQDLANMPGQRLDIEILPGHVRTRKARFPRHEFPFGHHWNVVYGVLLGISWKAKESRFVSPSFGSRAHFVRVKLCDGTLYRFEALSERLGKKWAAGLQDCEGVMWAEYMPQWIQGFEPEGASRPGSKPALGSAPERAANFGATAGPGAPRPYIGPRRSRLTLRGGVKSQGESPDCFARQRVNTQSGQP